MKQQSGNLGGDTVRSILVHGVLIAAALAVGSGATIWKPTAPDANAAASSATATQPAEAESSAAADPVPADGAVELTEDSPAPPPAAAFSVDLVEADLLQAIAGQLEESQEAALHDATAEWLRQQFQDQDISGLSGAELAELTEQLRQQGLQEMANHVQNLGRESLLAEARALLDGQIHDQLTARIEAELQGRLGDQLKRRLAEEIKHDRKERLDEAVGKVDELRKQLDGAARELEKARNTAAQERFDVAETTRAKVSTEVAKQLQQGSAAIEGITATVPQVTEAVGQAVEALDAEGAAKQLADASTPLIAKNKDQSVAQLEAARAGFKGRVDGLNRLRDALNKARQDRQPDPLSQAELDALLPRLRQMLGEELARQSSDEMAEQVATRLNEALKAPAEALGVGGEELREAVAQLTKERLAHNLRADGPTIDPAFASVRAELALRRPEEIAAANEAATAAREKLEALRDAQAAVDLSGGKPREQVLAEQQKVQEAFEAVSQSVKQATGVSRSASSRTKDRLNALDRQMVVAESERRLALLPQEVRQDDLPAATRTRDQLVQTWTAGIESLKDLEKTLGEEHQQAQAQAGAARPAVAVDDARIAALGDAMAQDVQAVAGELLPQAMRGAGEVDLRGVGQQVEMAMANVTGLFGQLSQMAANLADGRNAAGLDPLAMGMGALVGRGGPGLFDPRVAHYNAAAMELYGEEIRDRASPEAYYETVAERTGIATVAQPIDSAALPAMVYVEPATSTAEADVPAVERKVPEPSFKTLAFAAAAMVESPITVDGDLSDWGELRHPIPTRFEDDGSPARDPTNVYVRWSPEGLYVAYTTGKTGEINPNNGTAWQGDCFELWLDMSNARRKQVRESDTAHQFFLMPFGYKGNPADTLAEYHRGQRADSGIGTRVLEQEYGHAAAKVEAGVGYSVEAFISRRALSRPNLFPGAYLAMNYSLNRGWGSADWQQWSSPKSHATHDKPDTWGDLLLLGSDGHASFIHAMDDDTPAASVVPGAIISVQVKDKDMDLNPRRKDLLPAMLNASSGTSSLLVILEETAGDSGVFRASVNTQPLAAPPREGTLSVRGGDVVELHYTDVRAEYGEADREVTATVKVAAPVHHLASQ